MYYTLDMPVLTAAKKLILDLLFPARCAACGTEGSSLCPICDAGIRFIPPSCFVCKRIVPARGAVPAGRTCASCRKKSRISGFFSPFSYTAPAMKTLIHDLKYRRARNNADILGELLYRAIAYHGVVLARDSVIIPVPLHKARARTRGFNQAFLIARALGEKIGIPIRNDLLRKIKKTKPQMELAREERLKNMTGAFAVSDATAIKDKTIILLDDVKTTGATLEEAARALRGAGAKKVWAITVAH